jgi:molybdopterin converting factor small subunit
MCGSKVKLQVWIKEWPGSAHSGPITIEEAIKDGETLSDIPNRLSEQMPQFRESIFDPRTQRISEEVALVINDRVQSPHLLETKLQDGDRILFFPYLAGG